MYLVRPAIKFAEVYKKEHVVISGLNRSSSSQRIRQHDEVSVMVL